MSHDPVPRRERRQTSMRSAMGWFARQHDAAFVQRLQHPIRPAQAGEAAYSSTTRGKYSDTTQFGMSTMELMRRSAQTLHNM